MFEHEAKTKTLRPVLQRSVLRSELYHAGVYHPRMCMGGRNRINAFDVYVRINGIEQEFVSVYMTCGRLAEVPRAQMKA